MKILHKTSNGYALGAFDELNYVVGKLIVRDGNETIDVMTYWGNIENAINKLADLAARKEAETLKEYIQLIKEIKDSLS